MLRAAERAASIPDEGSEAFADDWRLLAANPRMESPQPLAETETVQGLRERTDNCGSSRRSWDLGVGLLGSQQGVVCNVEAVVAAVHVVIVMAHVEL